MNKTMMFFACDDGRNCGCNCSCCPVVRKIYIRSYTGIIGPTGATGAAGVTEQVP